MNITINEKKENALLGRTEVHGSISFEGATPSAADLTAELAKQLKVDEGMIVVKHLYTKFSHQEAVFHAVAYSNTDAMQKAEVMTKHLRKKAEEGAKKEAEKKEEVKVEGVPEEKAEESETKEKEMNTETAEAENNAKDSEPAQEVQEEAPAEEPQEAEA